MSNESVFVLLADYLTGSNLSGHNGPKGITITKEQLAQIQSYEADMNGLSQEHQRLLTEFRSVLNAKKTKVDSLVLEAFELEKSNSRLSSAFNRLTDESRRISQNQRSYSFVESRGRAYLRSIGVSDEVPHQMVQFELSKQQAYTYNIYILASADYAVIESTVHDYIVATAELLVDHHQGDTVLDSLQHEALTATHQKLIELSVEINRLDSDFFRKWFKERVGLYVRNSQIRNGEIILESMPSPEPFGLNNIGLDPDLIKHIKARLSDSAKAFIDNESDAIFTFGHMSPELRVENMLIPIQP